MKKRIISMLLTVMMVMSLFSGVSVGAYADNTVYGGNTIEYTMVEGDFVLRICQRLGLNYYTCKEAIMALNNINDGQWNKLAVGRTLILPASDHDAQLITSGMRANTYNAAAGTALTGTALTGTTITGTASTATTSTVNAAANAAANSDILAYYLVPYTMSYGETVSGVCNNLGVNFSKFSSFIAQVNGISNWKSVRAGDTLIIPTPVAPAVGTSCYAVMAHKVVNNDTAYNIASKNGVNYNASKSLLEALNGTTNLSALKVGSLFLYPKPMTVSMAGTGNPGGTATTTTTTTVADGNGTTTTTSTTTSKLYKLVSGMSSSDGTMLFYVDNAVVTAAPAGATVTVVTETNSGKAIESLTVKHSNGLADLRLSGDSFIMPSCDVRVDSAIKTGHDITINANYSGKVSASVGGVSVLSAVKGAAVVIRSVDPNYEIQSVTAYYNRTISATNKTSLTVSASNAFLMPDANVTVEVTLKPVTTYAFYVSAVDGGGNPTDNGSFYLQVNGNPVTRAAKGAQVTVVTRALDGYEAIGLQVTNHATGAAVNTFSNTFTMPGFDVDVQVTFGAKGNNIIILPANGGTVTSNPADEAPTGTNVVLTATPDAGYALDPTNPYDIVRNSDGLKVTVTGGNTFVMPKGGVTVTPNFRGGARVITSQFFLNGAAAPAGYQNASFTATITRNGQAFKGEFKANGDTSNTATTELRQLNANVFYGDYIDVRSACGEGMAFARYEITSTATDPEVLRQVEEANTQANINGYFQMPNTDITINAYFERGTVAIGAYAVIKGAGDVNYSVGGNSAAACMPGDTVRLTPNAAFGYRWTGTNTNFADKLIVTRKDNGAIVTLTPNLVGGKWCYDFVMPAEGVNIQVAFDPLAYTLTMTSTDEAGNNLNGLGLWQIAINGVVGAADNNTAGTTINVSYGDAVVVGMTESGITKYDLVGFRIDGHEYIADVVNYFYNFRMIDERAKDLNIVAILRPKTPYQVALHALNAYYDTSKGNVEFLLLDRNPLDPNTAMPTNPNDPTQQTSSTQYGIGHYSTVNLTTQNINPSSYEKAAIAGDYVAIVVDVPNNMYNLTANDITIVEAFGDSNRIIPSQVTGWTIGGIAKTFFVFQMPQGPVGISVKFTNVTYTLQVTVTDAGGTPVTQGLIQVNTGTSYRDVAADTTFDNMAYGAGVRIERTDLARSQNWVITAVDVLKGTPVPTTSIPYNGSFDSGVWFAMPDDNVRVNVTVEQRNPAVTVNYTVTPATASVFINSFVVTGPGGSFEAHEGDSIRISSAEAGYSVTSATDFIIPTNTGGTFTLPTITLAPSGNRLTVRSSNGVTPSFEAIDTATGNPIDINNVPTGMQVTVTPAESGKYVVKNVTATAADGSWLADNPAAVTFTMPAGGATVTVDYEVRDVNLTITYSGAGTLLVSINGATPIEYASGGMITLKVDDRVNYTIKDNTEQIASAVATPALGTPSTTGYTIPNTPGVNPGSIILALSP